MDTEAGLYVQITYKSFISTENYLALYSNTCREYAQIFIYAERPGGDIVFSIIRR